MTADVETTTTRARRAIVLSALAFYLLFVLRTSFTIAGTRYFVLFEDAMISMRYARHVAGGHGFVWNIGEPPIEGFTNLLWVLWMSVAHLLGMSESKISLFIMLSGVAIMLATGHVASKIARKLSSAPWVPLVALAATLFCYPLVFWTLRGMEVGALTLFVYTLLWLTLENEDDFSIGRTAMMAALAAGSLLIRSDSVVPVGLICLYGLLTAKKRFAFAAIIGGLCVAALGAQTAFRIHHFHDRLPNTYYLKLFHISAAARIKRGAFVALEVVALHLPLPIAVVLANVTGIRKDFYKDVQLRRRVLLGALFGAQIAYATYVGGDAWEWMLYANRYTCVGMPALILLSTVMVEALLSADAEQRAVFAKRLSIGFVVAGAILVLLNLYARFRPEQGIAATITFSKTPFAAGGAFIGLGSLLRLRDMREGISEGVVALRKYLGNRRTLAKAAIGLTVLMWAPSHLLPLGRWAAQNAAQYADEAKYTRLGLLIASATKPDFRIAVAAAGATPYFCQRPTEDLLGKNDRHIAKLAPRGVFSPGHDKWDYEWSLAERNSQLIVEAVDVNPEDEAYFKKLGFAELPNGMRLRDTADAKREIIGREMESGADLAEAMSVVGATLPPGFKPVDALVIVAFAALIGLLVFRVPRDADSLAELSGDPLPEEELDEGAKAALKGAESRQIPTLDGMRGLAVIGVLIFHFAWTFPGEDPDAAVSLIDKVAVRIHAFLWTGWAGVDLFFVLSGYLITRGLVGPSKRETGTRLKMFWMRRVLRIFPLYYAFVIVGTVIALALGGWIPGLSYWLYMQNYTLAFDHDAMRWTAHFWSLAIEEQFYFVWPLVAVLTPKKKLIWVIPLLVGAVVMLRAGLAFKLEHLAHLDEETVVKFVYRATPTRADGLLLGAFVAVTQREAAHPIAAAWRRLRYPILVSTALALVGLYAVGNGLNGYDRRVIVIGYVAMALFFASAVSMCSDFVISPRMTSLLESRPLVACGKVSYGMYIFHWPVVVLIVPRLKVIQGGMPTAMQLGFCTLVIAGGITLVYVAASISFRFFEQPFLKLKGRFHD